MTTEMVIVVWGRSKECRMRNRRLMDGVKADRNLSASDDHYFMTVPFNPTLQNYTLEAGIVSGYLDILRTE